MASSTTQVTRNLRAEINAIFTMSRVAEPRLASLHHCGMKWPPYSLQKKLCHGLTARLDVELFVDTPDVITHGVDAHSEFVRNLLIGESLARPLITECSRCDNATE